jgi:hypothetical protein
MNVRSYSDANVDSEYYLVMARIRATISNLKKAREQKRSKLNAKKKLQIREDVNTYKKEVRKQIQNAVEEEGDIEQMWNQCKQIIIKAAEKTLRRKEPQKRGEWFANESKEATGKKNEAYRNMLTQNCTRALKEEYKNLRQEEKRIHGRKKKEFENQLLREAEKSQNKNNSRKFYQIINNIRKEFKARISICKDKEGEITGEKKKILQRWVEHFDEMLNSDAGEEDWENHIVSKDIENLQEIEIGETENVIKKLNNNISPDVDGTSAELIKYGPYEIIEVIYKLI